MILCLEHHVAYESDVKTEIYFILLLKHSFNNIW